MKDSILIYSGGLDSTTMLYEFQHSIALAVSFDYGANHNSREIECAKQHCKKLAIEHIIIPLDFMHRYFRSSLLSGDDAIPDAEYDKENMASTVVPFRNAIMLAIATGLAESRKLKHVMMANHGGDHDIYPDCRPQFVNAMNKTMQAGTYDAITLLTPYTNISKTEIARKGAELGIDYSTTWSCYRGAKYHCGTCATCRERRQALLQAGIKDNTIYQNN